MQDKIAPETIFASIDFALLNHLKRTNIFVRVFSSFLRREFLSSPEVYHIWREYKLPLLVDVMNHLQTLAYASEKATPKCISSSDNRLIILDPQVVAGQGNRWNGLQASLASQLRKLMRSVEQHLGSPDIRYGMYGDESVVELLRDARLRMNEIVVLIKTWIDSFERRLDKPPLESYHPVSLYFYERHRRSLDDIMSNAARIIKGPSDVFTMCLYTRMAALTSLYELTLGSRTPVDQVLDCVVKLHNNALEAFDKVRHNSDENLWEHSRSTVEWRAKELLIDESEFGIKQAVKRATPEYGASQKLELFFVPSSKWLIYESLIPLGIKTGSNFIGILREPWDLCFGESSNESGKLVVELSCEDSAMNLQAQVVKESSKSCILKVTIGKEQLDSHLLFSLQILCNRIAGDSELSTSDLTGELNSLVNNIRSQAILELANSNLRMRSMIEMRERNYKGMLEIEEGAMPVMLLAEDGMALFAENSGFNSPTVKLLDVDRARILKNSIQRPSNEDINAHGFNVTTFQNTKQALLTGHKAKK